MFILKAWNLVIGTSQNVHATGNALHTLDEINAAIHQGEGYHFGKKLFLPPTGVAMLAGKTGPTKNVHFQSLSIDATTGPIEVSFYKNADVTSGTGTLEISTNRRLDITSGSQMEIWSSPTITNSGTLVVPGVNLATPSNGPRTIPLGDSFFHGFVLDLNKTYLIGMLNTDTSTATIWANFEYQEPTNK